MFQTLSCRHSSALIRRLTLSIFSRHNSLSSSATAAAAATASTVVAEPIQYLRLNTLQDNPGATPKKRRVGRGIGSSKGKTCGRGHKGQKARSGGSIPPTFEGGQTKFYKLLPKRGFVNPHATPMLPLNLGKIQNYIDMKRLNPSHEIGLRELQVAGLIKASAVKHGVKLLADGTVQQPLRLIMSRASDAAIAAVEAAGGSVTTVHYNRLALRSVLRPHKFDSAPKHARPPPKWQPYYTSWKNRGYLNPQMQMQEWLEQHPEYKDEFDRLLQEATAAEKGDTGAKG